MPAGARSSTRSRRSGRRSTVIVIRLFEMRSRAKPASSTTPPAAGRDAPGRRGTREPAHRAVRARLRLLLERRRERGRSRAQDRAEILAQRRAAAADSLCSPGRRLSRGHRRRDERLGNRHVQSAVRRDLFRSVDVRRPRRSPPARRSRRGHRRTDGASRGRHAHRRAERVRTAAPAARAAADRR